MKHLFAIATMFLFATLLFGQEEGTRILYPRQESPDAEPVEPAEPETEPVRYSGDSPEPEAPVEPEAPAEPIETERVLYPAETPEDSPAAEMESDAPEISEEGYEQEESYAYYPRRPRRSQTLLGNRGRGSGFYGAFSVNAGEIANQNAILIGGRAAWVMGGGFGLGFGGSVLANDVVDDFLTPGEDMQLEMAYGGLYLEPMIASRSPIHLSFPVLLGVGGAIYTENSFRYNDRFNWDRDVVDSDLFFVLEPGAYLEFHIVRFFRVGLGAQYRILSDLDLANTAGDAFNGWTAGLTLKFGNY